MSKVYFEVTSVDPAVSVPTTAVAEELMPVTVSPALKSAPDLRT